jgi:integrase/recombinase XerD
MWMTRAPWDITREMFLSEEEVALLLRHVRSKTGSAGSRATRSRALDRLIIEGLLFSGLRCSEFCAVRVADTVVGSGRSAMVVRGQREGGRTVWVPAYLSALIRSFVAHVRPHFLADGSSPQPLTQPLVISERGHPFERTGLYRRVVRIMSEAGLGARASVQLLRHTYGYLAYLRTAGNLLFVQRQLGHAHPMITSIYAQFVDERYADLANVVSRSWRTRRGHGPAPDQALKTRETL